VFFDEDNLTRATAEGFEANGAGTGECVDETTTDNQVAENIEQGFAQTVAGRTKVKAFQAVELATAKFAGDYAHKSRSANACEMVAALPFARQDAQHILQTALFSRIFRQRKCFLAGKLEQLAIAQRIGHLES
jgi:hypothetical protein